MASREPFSRHRGDGTDDARPAGERLIAAYEFAASEWGWAPQAVEEELSDEQFVAYLDAAHDRLTARRTADFDQMVEAVRAGTVVAHNKKAADKWRRDRDRRSTRKQRGLTGAALESAVMNVAQMFPGNVVHGAPS